MNQKVKKVLSIIFAFFLSILFGSILMVYIKPMEDISLNLSLTSGEENVEPEDFDNKGWTVYIKEEENRTELEPDGYGGYLGIELGQTFYFSRVMEEELESPTLQLGAVNRKFSVWLDDALIYTDCPELDNRIGYVTLPMNEWDRTDKITISLPLNYQGKTLTIAQSFPNYTEGGSVKAYPCSVMLYCGYAYESELIAESFGTAILTGFMFVIGMILLIVFVRNQDVSMLCLALVAFLQMISELMDVSFFYTYFGTYFNYVYAVIPQIFAGALLIFLAIRGGKYKKILWSAIGIYLVSVVLYVIVMLIYEEFHFNSFVGKYLAGVLQRWCAFICLMMVLVFSIAFWHKESWFYHIFVKIAPATLLLYWMIIALTNDNMWEQIIINLQVFHIDYIYYKTVFAIAIATLVTAIVEAFKKENERRMEKQLVKERQELALASYKHMRRQHEEVMMLRHDMMGHLRILKDMSSDKQVIEYLKDLIGQNQKVRSVVQTGNEMLDTILNSKLSGAIEEGIQVEIAKLDVIEKLPLRDVDLCSLVINIMDNAIKAAKDSDVKSPFIKLNMQMKNNYFAIVCENSANRKGIEKEYKKETVPKHGLGLKIIKGIVERYHGLMNTEYGEKSYKIQVAIPLS